MAVPQRRTSKTAKRLRRSHIGLKVNGVTICEHCGAMIKQHTVCPKCGYYDGVKRVEVSKENKEAK